MFLNKEFLKLYEELSQYNSLPSELTYAKNILLKESLNEDTTSIELLWTNPDGIEIDLNDPNAFQRELDAEKKRYQLYLRKRFLTDASPDQKARHIDMLQKISNRAVAKGTSLATEIQQTVYKHMEAYKSKLKKEKDKLAAANSVESGLDKIWYISRTAYDMSTETGAIAYINRKTVNNLGAGATPERLKARLVQLGREIVPKLTSLGYYDVAERLNTYINDQVTRLDCGEIPAELMSGIKKPALIKRVRNKEYDISDPLAFGSYLSFSYRDLLAQNPGMSEDDVRKLLCSQALAELRKEPVNPTTTTAIKQLEKIIDSPTEFYNFIHARRLANIRSAEKRKQRKQSLL